MGLFLKEVRTLAKLHHRNIVQFYGASLDPDRAMFFVTELMKGGDLYSALRHHPDTMRWDKLGRKVALDVALGINYLHTRRPPLLHRDLKSPNVLLSEEGVAKIADVGMVRSQVKDLVTAQPVMTPLWAAPEVRAASCVACLWFWLGSINFLCWRCHGVWLLGVLHSEGVSWRICIMLVTRIMTSSNLTRPHTV